jgi:hypothetical protein
MNKGLVYRVHRNKVMKIGILKGICDFREVSANNIERNIILLFTHDEQPQPVMAVSFIAFLLGDALAIGGYLKDIRVIRQAAIVLYRNITVENWGRKKWVRGMIRGSGG